MIGDPKIPIAAGASSRRHDLKCVDAIRKIGVRVENTAHILVGNEIRRFIANSISSVPSRSSGGMKGKPSALYMSCSVRPSVFDVGPRHRARILSPRRVLPAARDALP